jgi:hypothetical protein
MTKRFFVATNGMSADNRDKLTKYLRDKPWGYWHWFSEVWILAGVPATYTARILHDEFEESVGLAKETMIVLEIPDGQIKYWGMANPLGWKWMDDQLNT